MGIDREVAEIRSGSDVIRWARRREGGGGGGRGEQTRYSAELDNRSAGFEVFRRDAKGDRDRGDTRNLVRKLSDSILRRVSLLPFSVISFLLSFSDDTAGDARAALVPRASTSAWLGH